MVERGFWHPVLAASALGKQAVAVSLLGEAVVLWRDGARVARAWADQCPHRGARLSLGSVVAGQLVCAYHGWRFDADGRCTHVPAQPEWVPPASHCARRYACMERHGLVWVRLDNPAWPDEALAAAAHLPDWHWTADPRLQHTVSGPYTVGASATRLVENFLDMSHFGFVHPGSLGDPAHTDLAAYAVLEGAFGVSVPECKVWQPTAFANGLAAQVSYRYDVNSAYRASLQKTGSADVHHIGLAICPHSAFSSTVWFCMANTPQGLPDSDIVAFQDRLFEQDRAVVASQTPQSLPLDPSAECHGPLDRVSAAYRRYLRRLGVTTGVLISQGLV